MRSSLAILFALPLAAWAQTPRTEAEALRLGLSRAELSDLARSTIESAEADVMVAGQPPNPVFGYTREQTRGSPRTLEHSLQISQTFDIAGRRQLHRDAAARRSEVAAVGNIARRVDAGVEIRLRFYETLVKQQVANATEIWVERFARVDV